MKRRRRAVSALIAAVVLPVSGRAFAAPTDYFWVATSGTNATGTWDTTLTTNWSTTAGGTANYKWTNSGDERANFTTTPAGTVTLDPGGINAYGLNLTISGYVFTGGTLTLTGTGGFIGSASVGGTINTTINSVLAGNVGLTKLGGGTLTLDPAAGPNTFSGAITIGTFSTLLGTGQASGSAFGAATNTVSLSSGALRLNSIASTTTTNIGAFTVNGFDAAGTGSGASNLILDNSTGASNSATTTLAAGNLSRGGAGAVLAITPGTGTLGTGEMVSFANGNALLTNTILPAWVVTQTSGVNPAVDFVTHAAAGVIPAIYSPGDLNGATSTNVINQTAAISVTSPKTVYALKTNAAISLGGNALTIGNGSGTAGLILNNGGSVTGGNISFGSAEGMVYVQGTATLGAGGNNVSSNGLTMVASGASTVTLAANITDGTSASHVSFTGITSGTGLTISGANTYTGGTTLEINTGSAANVVLGSDAAFGTGKVTNILPLGASSPQVQATAARTLANAFDLNGGLTFTGTNNITFTGPITIINGASGGSRTLQNANTANITFGSAATPSTITVGNPVANGGDGVGKTVVFNVNLSGATITINDVIQDPAASAGGSVTYSGVTGGTIIVNSLSTYTGTTTLNGGNSAIQFTKDYVAGGTSGPFGLGTLSFTNTTNNFLQPIGGNRTLANPVSFVFGMTVSNATADTSSITFTGPMAMTSTASRTITNSLSAGATMTFGSSATPSTFTLGSASGVGVTLASGGTTAPSTVTVINDVIKDGAFAGAVTVSSTGTVTFNALNTFSGGTTLSAAGTIIPITLDSTGSPGSVTAGPFGTGAITFNNSTNQHLRPTGGNRIIHNALTLTTGFTMENNTGESFNLTFAGPITMGTANRFISNGFAAGTTGGTLILGLSGQASTLILPNLASGQLSLAAFAGPITINDVIQNASGQSNVVAINPNANNVNAVTLNGANTYTGGTTIGGGAAGGGSIVLGANSAGPVGNLTSGPLGTGTVTMNQSTTPPILIPGGADRTIGNAITMTSGFWVGNLPSTSFNLNLNGPISLTTAGRVLTNNMAGTLTIGTPATTTAIVLGSTGGQQLQFQTNNANSTTIVNEVIKDASGGGAGAIVVASGTVTFAGANAYSGLTTVSGGKLIASNTSGSATGTSTVAIIGTGAIGSGGTLGGTGTITGPLSISSTTSTQQGGIVSPGNSAGTLNVASMVMNPGGRYVFEHSVSSNTAGGGVNDLIAGTGALDLSTLAPISTTPGAQFDLNLVPLTGGTPQATYTLATFAGGITGAGGPIGNNTDVTSLFTFSGSEAGIATTVTVVPAATGQSLQLTLSVPEPGTLGLTAAAAGMLLMRRRRR